ncbi:MAG TPA: response regulator [Pirellulales bacterium]|nr:response regulator [Pirellulales bacterium]
MTGHYGQESLCILVIDDNCDAADVLGMLLRMLGHTVHTAHSGAMGLDQIESIHPDLIFLDLGMPNIDGYEVARRVRQNPKLTDTRVIAVTGFVDQRRRDLAAEAGFDDYLIKPTNVNQLQEVIGRTRDLLVKNGQSPHSHC